MRVLFLCNKSPYPPKEGGPIAMNNLIEGLSDEEDLEVKVLAVNSNKYSVSRSEIPNDYLQKTNIEHEYIDLSIRPLAAFLNLFTNKSYHAARFYTKSFAEKLIQIIEEKQYDIIQLETIFLGVYLPLIRKHSPKTKVVLRAHNIEHLIWKRLAKSTTNPIKKIYIRHLARTLEKFELNLIQDVDGIAPITKVDEEFFCQKASKPVHTISFGVYPDKYSTEKPSNYEFPSICHLGSMNWLPNIEGIKWFLNSVWQIIKNELPEVRFYIAGREMPEWLKNLNLDNVIVLGEVDDAQEFVLSKAISIAPLLSGSGVRIKIIESMAMGRAVVATSVGAEGINYSHDDNIMIADTPRDFANALIECVTNREFCEELGVNARELICEEHNIKKIIPILRQFYEQLLSK